MDTATISLPRGLSALIDKDDAGRVGQFTWSVIRTPAGSYYAVGTLAIRGVLLHRFLLNAPPRLVVDHINHNTLDNRRSNLRLCSHGQNLQNSKIYKNNTSGFRGVFRDGHRWVVQIAINKRRVTVGRFSDKETAARAYDAAAIKHYGEFAAVNFPQTT
jgi:hypothetical protein